MRIGVIGAGHVGSTLARHFTAAEHQVVLANSRGPETLRTFAFELGDNAYPGTAAEAAEFGEVVVVSIPFGNFARVPVPGTAGKTVIDTMNYDPRRDGHVPPLDDDSTTSSEMLQAHLPDARVVKAFNAMRWDHIRDYGRPGGALTRYGIPVAGDDSAAKLTVIDLVDEMGFEPVDAGDLAHGGRKHQPGTAVFTADLTAGELRARLPGVDRP
jgi:8-hydroxy-5-deazaflavin:NADPH oxidoreductase